MSSFHDQFEPNADFPDWFEWTTEKPFFRDARVEFEPHYPEQSESEAESEVEVTAFCETSKEFGSLQENAWNFLIANAEAIDANLRRKLFVHHLKGYRGFVDELVPDFEDDELDGWNEIKDAIDWESPAAIDHLYELTGIGLLDDGFDECGFYYFDFQSGWDEEHGVSVLMHRAEVLAAGGMAEFSNRGPGLIPHAKSIQEYDFDEGDFRLADDH